MAQVVIPRDAEALIRAYLLERLPAVDQSAPVHSRVPRDRPVRFVEILLSGGSRGNIVSDDVLVSIRGWDAADLTALALTSTAYALLLALPESETHGKYVRAVTSVGGPVPLPDPETNTPRYQATVSINIRPDVLTG